MTASQTGRSIVAGLCALMALAVGPLSGPAWASHSVGQPHPSSSLQPATSSELVLCQLTGSVNRLTVTRNHNANPITFTFPETIKSTDKARVQALARALCTLPRPPSTEMYCVVDLGVRYTLHFWNHLGNEAVARPVVVDPEGCQFVTGLDSTRWTENRPQFWTVLGAAIGLPHVSRATFTGRLSNSSS
jgi:hypothetical protein